MFDVLEPGVVRFHTQGENLLTADLRNHLDPFDVSRLPRVSRTTRLAVTLVATFAKGSGQ